MNLLVLSPGRRVELVKEIRRELKRNGGGFLFTADISELAPATYFSFGNIKLKKKQDSLKKYISQIIQYCLDKKISWIITFVDPDLRLLSRFRDEFEKFNINLILSSDQFVENTFDKWKFYTQFQNTLPLVETFLSKQDLVQALEEKRIHFPIIAKDRFGSGSKDIFVFDNKSQFKSAHLSYGKFIFQPKLEVVEYGIDCYFDLISGKMIDLFIKKKIRMRSGETDKSVSVAGKKFFPILNKLKKLKGVKGPVDIDLFEVNGKFMINEINPRFGGGYYHAHHCGVKLVNYLVRNLKQKINQQRKLMYYETDVVMMKYYNFYFTKK